MMERKFCGKCGKPIGECVCNVTAQPTTSFDRHSTMEAMNHSGSYYIKRFDKIALIQDEVVVKQYHIGEFAKNAASGGKGSASIIITNKRIISKQDSDYLGSSSTSIEEIALESVVGVKNYFSQGYTVWRLASAAVLALVALVSLFSGEFRGVLTGLIFGALAVYMGISSRKPSYLFSIYASSTGTAMEMGVNLRGKLFSSNGNSILFQYKPTKEAVKMMCEIGACIVDLKQKGDFAIDAWKKA